MPTGAHVIGAFKNLIRYGKHAKHDKHDKSPSSTRDDSEGIGEFNSASSGNMFGQSHNSPQTAQDPTQPRLREAAEIIVNEEREAKAKMPTYSGLESFGLVEKMGDGAFSNVYKATDKTTGRNVAVKIVRKYELNSSQTGDKHLNPQFKKKPRVTERSNILKEVQIMRGTNHPSIVKLFSFSESPDHYFLVLELMEGGELFHQIVKLTYFSENLSRHVILQVAHGIRHLHEECGVVHRDIKPENLLFTAIPIVPSPQPIARPYDEEKVDEGVFSPGVGGGGIGRVKIADFGLSKVVWNEETMTPCGTVGYTAPEIVKDERYSKSVDMWALGCVLYTLLCGFPPFYDESINVLTEKVARGYYTFLSPWWDDISYSAKDLIQHLLCVDPARRYTIDEFLAHPWCTAAPAPLPPPTPFMYPATSLPYQARPLDSPLLRGQGRGSPGIATLKEAFDITYAVHRMEEEGARRRGRGAAGARFLGGLNEEDEGGADTEGVANINPTPQSVVDSAVERDHGRAGNRDMGGRGRGNEKRGFELDMKGATLLGRRMGENKRVTGAAKGSPLARTVDPGPPGGEGSPMWVM